ncbi:SIMPL domain-containing protein [Ichthyobacterium seriolicida]|uniref:SIMPL domain-containing protein n=1 Tax=Ichthyobacterium seriolicida TaxID=242600 RepID=A0A1J1E582_9FLAO|nr:SIMPL domain-containing protein [Ichthyobacterium seriolicida]BAV94462.1 hypothetical protein JBKA6_0449 [Ichthyobacterium seriolicida]
MKNRQTILLSLILSVGIILSSIAIANTLVKGEKVDRFVTVIGSAQRDIEVDLGVLHLNIGHCEKDQDLSEVKNALDSKIQFIYDYLESKGIEKREIEQSHFYVSLVNFPVDDYSDSQYESDRYYARVELVVKTHNVDALRESISDMYTLISKDITLSYTSHVGYMVRNLAGIETELKEEATKNARELAEKFGVYSNSTIGGIKKVHQGDLSVERYDFNSTLNFQKASVSSTVEFYLID